MPTILVVEYDHNARVAIRRVLEGAGYSVISRTDAKSAMETLREYPSMCLIVLEWSSVGSAGPPFLEEKSKDARLAPIPVVVINEPGTEFAAPEVVSTLTKPLNLGLLLEMVKRSC